MEQTCQGCGRHCPLSSLSCERGRRLNGQEETKDAQTGAYENTRGNFNEYGGRHEHGHGFHHGGRGEHREYSEQEFAALSTDDKILVKLKGLGHTLHFSELSAEQLLSPLTAEEKSTLLTLLSKLS